MSVAKFSSPIASTGYVAEMKQAGLQIKSEIFHSKPKLEETKDPVQTALHDRNRDPSNSQNIQA